MLNMDDAAARLRDARRSTAGAGRALVDTALPSPDDIAEPGDGAARSTATRVRASQARSIVVLVSQTA